MEKPLDLNKATPEELLDLFKEDELTKKRDKDKRLEALNSHPQNKKFHIDMDKVEKA